MMRIVQECDSCGKTRTIPVASEREQQVGGWRILDTAGKSKRTACNVCMRAVMDWLAGAVVDRPRQAAP